MNWRNIDLNLLVVFDAVAQTRSATKAGAKLNMAQPAISHALSRLRGALRDDLFIRTPDGMEPTPYAQRLEAPIRAALQELGTALDGVAEFDPATAERSFQIAADNRASLILSAPLVAAVAAEAPGVSLSISTSGTLDLAERLDRGDMDLALGGLSASRRAVLRSVICGKTASSPWSGPGIRRRGTACISLEDLAASRIWSFRPAPRTRLSSMRRWRAKGWAAGSPSAGPLLSSVAVLTASDMVAVMGERGGDALARFAPLQLLSCRLRRRGLRPRCSGIGGMTISPRTVGCAASCAGSHGHCRLHVEPA